MENIGGNLVLELYDDDLLAGKVKGKANIEAKYREMNFTGMNDIEADLYNCELSTGDAGNINIYTKYSKIHSANAGTLNIDSYEDDFSFDNCDDIKYIAKYSEFTTGKAGKLVADNYECRFEASVKYHNFDIDENIFRIKKHIEDGNELLYVGFKGTEKEGMPQLRITGYEVDLNISEY